MLIMTGSEIKDNNNNEYVLDEALGKGGFGCVYKAHRKSDGELFAVKTLTSDFKDENAILSFKKELQQSMVIESPHVIKYHYANDGIELSEYPPFIIMEYASDGDLRTIIDNQIQTGNMFSNEFIRKTCLQLAEGMRAINGSLVHRDIKPENILISNDLLKISDFGLSKIAGEATRTKSFKGGGTIPYMAPEAWTFKENTIQMDIYSMGIVFYELATLSYPYTINSGANEEDFKKEHLFGNVISPNSINRSIDPTIAAIIIRMLEKPLQKRYKSWESIIDDLGKVIDTEDKYRDVLYMALSVRNEKDIKEQTRKTKEKEEEEKRNTHIKLVKYQYESKLLNPIKKFVERFNDLYPGENKIRIGRNEYNDVSNTIITYINTQSGTVSIRCEIIFKENFIREEQDWFTETRRTVHYVPQVKNRDVLLWGVISDWTGIGFNVLLLKSSESEYGDWFLLENTNSGLARVEKVEPFGFDLDEIKKEIYHINALHIYNSKLSELPDDYILEFVGERV